MFKTFQLQSNNYHSIPQRGFTIVELLIVIVVIGILAAIVIVAFNGVQNRANDTTVQSNLRGIGTSIQNAQILSDTGEYPSNTSAAMQSLVKVNKSSYQASGNNFGYCQITSGANKRFSIVGRSKSGKGFYYSSVGGLKEMTGWNDGNVALCPLANVDSTDPNYRFLWIHVNNNWETWVQ